MATSQAEAQLIERKLRPLYDAVDNGQNKKAIQLADKLLRKQEDLYPAKALKAIALLRTGRSDEGHSVVDQVVRACPGDQATLQAVSMFYKETGEYEKVSEVYAVAAKHYPKNEDILTHLFMSYVRVGDYQKLQQTGATLQKTFPDNGAYYCWRVMSVLLQAHVASNATVVQTMYLPLAERLINKYVDDKRMDAEAEVRLYLMILEKLGHTEKTLEVLNSELGRKIRSPLERGDMEVSCLVKLCRWEEAAGRLRETILDNPDNWASIKMYIHCQVKRVLLLAKETVGCEGGMCVGGEGEKGEEGKEKGCTEEEEEEERGAQGEEKGDGEGGGCEGEKGGERGGGEEEERGHGDCKTEEGEGGGGEREGVERSKDGEEGRATELEGGACALSPALKLLVETRDFLNGLAEAERAKASGNSSGSETRQYVLRGPLLARLELHRAVEQSLGAYLPGLGLGSQCELMMDYFQAFCSKNCCFEDLSVFLEGAGSVEPFISAAEGFVGREEPVQFDCREEDIRENVTRLRKEISLMELQRCCGRHKRLTAGEKRALAEECERRYKAGLQFGLSLPSTVDQYSDFYALLAAHLRMELYQELGEWNQLYEAIVLLEEAKNFNSQIKLLLMKLYCYIGATEMCADLYSCLSIKHIQVESVGFLAIRYMQAAGTFQLAEQLYRAVLSFYANKETSEYLVHAFKNGVFQKICEIVDFSHRLNRSVNFASVTVDMRLLEFATTVNSFEKAKKLLMEGWACDSFLLKPENYSSLLDASTLRDGRQLDVFEDWNCPEGRLTAEEKEMSFELEVLWLRIRLGLFCCMQESLCLLGARGAGATSGRTSAATGSSATPPSTTSSSSSSSSSSSAITGGVGEECNGIPNQQRHHHEQQNPTTASVSSAACHASPSSPPSSSSSLTASLKEKVEEFSSVLQLARQHKMMEALHHKYKERSHFLPVQSAPPSLAYMFVTHLYGKALAEVLSVTLLVAEGAASVEDKLKTTTEVLQDAQSRMQGVPEELKAPLVANDDTEEAAHPYDVLRRKEIQFESYAMFVQVVGFITFLCGVCLKKLNSSSSRKKKKKKSASTGTGKVASESQVCKELVTFMKEVRLLLLSLSKIFQQIPSVSDEEANTLKERYICLQVARGIDKEKATTAALVCRNVMDSYRMSLGDIGGALLRKVEFLNSLLAELN